MRVLGIIGLTILLQACGGGGGNTTQNQTPTTPPVTPPSGSTWQSGVFASEDVFKNRCEVPRTGTDLNGNTFPDIQGTTFDEQMWLRSWSNDTYLWYSEITDQNPQGFSTSIEYFNVLKTEELTASGAAKDNFHFSQSTEEYESFAQSGSQTGYGINWSFIRNSPPRSLRVSTVEPNSSASDAGVLRGDTLLSINGVDFINGSDVDAINNGLFPENENTETEFVFERNDGTEVTLTLRSGNFEKSFVNNTKIIDTDAGRVGYFRFDGFQRPGQTPLIDTFQTFVNANVTQLVMDLRYNGGGLLAMASQLGYMIAGPNQTNNAIFESSRFNDKYTNTNPVTGDSLSPTPFYDREIDWDSSTFTNRQLPSVNLSRIYVITTDSSCSASEALINSLRGIDIEVIQIGGTTCGKPYGFYPTGNCGTTYFTIQFQGVNNKNFGDYADGFKPTVSPQFDDELPGCVASDDFNNPLGNEQEGMLSAALFRMTEGICPSSNDQVLSSFANTKKTSNEENDKLSVFDARYRAIMLENSINTPILESQEK
ncbi:S41 family peptidase [Glaciecola petra]|uniref:S41 family peptidase n=1 Tax=Glaciecola petra TaxID=3075602 RepID=A0ABU2ZR00_9ALTE|nr:S41 family peptidase [Aestuariibacter sp. P117]MDT0595060.1 S41 family peptidase [Aestuariibacter sp. P117]